MVAPSDAATGDVAMPNVACVAPAATTTLAGTRTCGTFEERSTVAPPAGAGAPRVTVPSTPTPPSTLALVSEMLTMPALGGRTCSVAVTALPDEAVITADVGALVVMVNCAETLSSVMMTLDGTTTAGSELESAIEVPPARAGAARRTVPMTVVPPVTVLLLSESEVIVLRSLIAPLTGTAGDDSGSTFESVALTVNVSPATPATSTLNEPSAFAFAVNCAALRTFVAVITIGVSLSETVPAGAET